MKCTFNLVDDAFIPCVFTDRRLPAGNRSGRLRFREDRGLPAESRGRQAKKKE